MIVIDASAAVAIVRAGHNSAVLTDSPIAAERFIAPAFLQLEAAQVAWKYTHIGMLDNEGAREMMRATIGCIDDFYEDASLTSEALAEATKLDHSFYDMLYFVLARRTASPLLTCDRKLAALCEANNVEHIELASL